MNHELRWGRFTSSKIASLMAEGTRPMTDAEMAEYKIKEPKGKRKNITGGFGAPALKYIKQKKYERKLKRRIDSENTARPLQYGRCAETVAFQQLSTEYRLCSDQTIIHPQYPFFAGSPDVEKFVINEKILGEVKCPMTLESFCDFVDYYEQGGIQAVRDNHPDGETYYWQMVGNAILIGANKAELIIYCPYQSELAQIRDEATFLGYQWIVFAHDDELPYLIKGNHYKNINILPFDIPQDDIDALTANIIKANELCTEYSFPITIHDSIKA